MMGKGKQDGKGNPGENLPDEMQDERYKNLDPKMVEMIECTYICPDGGVKCI